MTLSTAEKENVRLRLSLAVEARDHQQIAELVKQYNQGTAWEIEIVGQPGPGVGETVNHRAASSTKRGPGRPRKRK